MANALLVQADKCRDGVLIALEADSLERRIQALEATLRATESLRKDIERELEHLVEA